MVFNYFIYYEVITPVFDKFKYPVIISIIIALLFGFLQFEATFLGITRTFAYFPIFLIGFKYKDYKNIFNNEYPKLSKLLSNKLILLLLFIIAIIVCIISL